MAKIYETVDLVFHSEEQRAAFVKAVTGQDDDVCLAMEAAIERRIDPDEVMADRAGARVWISPHTDSFLGEIA